MLLVSLSNFSGKFDSLSLVRNSRVAGFKGRVACGFYALEGLSPRMYILQDRLTTLTFWMCLFLAVQAGNIICHTN